ncbi:4-diphosphocytidyl-2-C-methyl-D-erythritol kinase [Streptomyces hundungensis]|uniref:4-diphosphocytidyl-2-C-methyl-D-erythritol kinase n=1 Tax=Streptomyces hundungensis TaxID=1077946 RepID=A0A387HFU1_9ACTN|nr:4-diphosphocytidyl-2-C-methyl-D-erythritol kinase [Streptomyces hundungensis]
MAPVSTPRIVTARVPAKVNVQLGVGPARPDGFHDLANVFLAVALYDTVTATPADTLRITCDGPDAAQVPLDRTNLAARAAELLAARHGIEPAVHLHIDKDIPVAGGMAGGSADGAGALLACDALWGTNATRAELLDICAELGSDVPFSLVGGAALGTGRGEKLAPLDVGGTFHWVFAVADGGLSTPAVYREFDRLTPDATAPRPHRRCSKHSVPAMRRPSRAPSPTTSRPPRSPCAPPSRTPSRRVRRRAPWPPWSRARARPRRSSAPTRRQPARSQPP